MNGTQQVWGGGNGQGWASGVVSTGASISAPDVRPEFAKIDEDMSKALLALDESLRGIGDKVVALGGPYGGPQSAPLPPSNSSCALDSLRDRVRTVAALAGMAAEVRARLSQIVS